MFPYPAHLVLLLTIDHRLNQLKGCGVWITSTMEAAWWLNKCETATWYKTQPSVLSGEVCELHRWSNGVESCRSWQLIIFGLYQSQYDRPPLYANNTQAHASKVTLRYFEENNVCLLSRIFRIFRLHICDIACRGLQNFTDFDGISCQNIRLNLRPDALISVYFIHH